MEKVEEMDKRYTNVDILKNSRFWSIGLVMQSS